MQKMSNILSSSFALRFSSYVLRPSNRLSTPAKFLRVTTSTSRVLKCSMSTQQFPSFVPEEQIRKAEDADKERHNHKARDVIGDLHDRQHGRANEEKTPESRWMERSKTALQEAKNTPPANAFSGRTVDIRNEGDLATAYRVLDGILQRNRVRVTLRQTERHEKPGVKRRRLSSERWRKRFADEVRKKVKLVMKIRDRGA